MSVTRGQCDARPYGYIPSHQASPPIGWYQIILLGTEAHVLTPWPGLHSTAGRLGFESNDLSLHFNGHFPGERGLAGVY